MENDKFGKHFKRCIDILVETGKAETFDAENAEKRALGKISQRRYAKRQQLYVDKNLKAQQQLKVLLDEIQSSEQFYFRSAYDILLKIIFLEIEALELCIEGIEKDDPSYIHRSKDRRNEASELIPIMTKEINKAKALEKEAEK